MKAVYPIILRKRSDHIVVTVPDFKINTHGTDFADAMKMARDTIGLMGIEMEDENEEIPKPSNLSDIIREKDSDILTLVDIDFTEYRRQNDLRTVRRNVSLPSWLNVQAEKAGVNVSAVLQAALKQELQLYEAPGKYTVNHVLQDEMDMKTMLNSQITELKQKMDEHKIFDRFHLNRIGVFGSVARNEKSNDIDILIEDTTDYRLLSELRNELEAIMNKRVDLVIAQYANPIVLHRARKDIIYVNKQ